MKLKELVSKFYRMRIKQIEVMGSGPIIEVKNNASNDENVKIFADYEVVNIEAVCETSVGAWGGVSVDPQIRVIVIKN